MSRLSVSALAAVAALGLGAAAVAPAGAAPAVVELGAGHVDVVDVAYDAGAFSLSVHDESVTPDVERDPADVLLVAGAGAKAAAPASPAYAFLGAPGSTVWVLPEVQDSDLLWPGLSAEEVAPGTFTGDSVQVEFTQIAGPDGVSIFSDEAGVPTVLLDSEDAAPDTVTLAAGDHVHANWAFEAAGQYALTYRVRGTLASTGSQVVSDPATITFSVRN